MPTDVMAAPGNGEATVSFSAPPDQGGSAITSYLVAGQPGSVTKVCIASPCTVTGWSNGTPYTFTVVATNAVGDSAASDASTAVTPVSPPRPVVEWFVDPLSAKERKKLAPIPAHPRRTKGPLRATKALHRTHNGTLAVSLKQVRGHQLARGQQVQGLRPVPAGPGRRDGAPARREPADRVVGPTLNEARRY